MLDRMLERKKVLSVTFLKIVKCISRKESEEIRKINVKCNFEKNLKQLRRKKMHKNVVRKLNINFILNPPMAVSFILMATTDPTDMNVTLKVASFWFMFAMTLDHVQLNVKTYQESFFFNLKKIIVDLLLQSS